MKANSGQESDLAPLFRFVQSEKSEKEPPSYIFGIMCVACFTLADIFKKRSNSLSLASLVKVDSGQESDFAPFLGVSN